MNTMLNLIMLLIEIYIFKKFKFKKTVKNFKFEKTVNLISNYNKLNSSHPSMIEICF